MARVTVEDCIDAIPNRFDLVVLSARRARDIASGAALRIERDNDKNPVVALREIAEKATTKEELYEQVINSMRRVVAAEESEEELIDDDEVIIGSDSEESMTPTEA